MRFLNNNNLNNNNIMMCCSYGLRIFLVISLLSVILLFSETITSKNGIDPASCNEYSVIQSLQIIQTDPNFKSQINLRYDPNQYTAKPFIIQNPFSYCNIKDQYEPDDDPNQANLIATQNITSPDYTQLHTFHDSNDMDWVYFFGLKNVVYHFHVIRTEGEGFVKITLFNEDGREELCFNPNSIINSFSWRCPQSEYYNLKLNPLDMTSFCYSLWICEHFTRVSAIELFSSGIYGRVVNQNGDGINGIHISLKATNSGSIIETGNAFEDNNAIGIYYSGGITEGKAITRSIGPKLKKKLEQSMIDGWFFIDGLSSLTSYTVNVSEEADPNDPLINPFTIDELTERDIKRIPDIQISFIDDSPSMLNDPNDIQVFYTIWKYQFNVENYVKEDDPDNDEFSNFKEFLNGTAPKCYTINSTLPAGLNVLPFSNLSADLYMASTFCTQLLIGCHSIWDYNWDNDRHKKVWKCWDVNSMGEDFEMKFGKAYIIYKKEKETDGILKDAESMEISLTQGMNICTVPLNSQGGPYSSYEFINDKDPEGIKSISSYNNPQDADKKPRGTWESTYIFFGRPGGKDFFLSPENAFVIGVKQ